MAVAERSLSELVKAFKADPKSLSAKELKLLRREIKRVKGGKPVKPPAADVNARNRASSSARHAATSRAGRDIWPIPDIADVERRERCRESLRLFFETYNPEPLYFPWAPFHLKAMERIQEAATLGALYAFAMPRGSGKTAVCRMGALWAVSYGHCRYAFLIGANAQKAEDNLAAIKTFIRFLPRYAADFPDLAHAATKLRGIANRAAGQICNGEDNPTMMEWSKERIILPTVPPPSNWPDRWPLRSDGMVPTSGSVVGTSGLTGDGIRGSVLTLTTGELLRPDLVLLDDPQTDEALDVNTPIPTRNGFVRMADLQVGDTVFEEKGLPCQVTAVSDVMHNRECFRVTFDDDSYIIADGGHLWNTSTALQRTNNRRKVLCPDPSRSRRPQCQARPFHSTVTTKQIRDTLTTAKDIRFNHSIPLCGPVTTNIVSLPIPPYTLGVWLGDGASASGRITTADPEILDYVREDGFEIGPGCSKGDQNKAMTYTVLGLRGRLNASGLLGSKSLPAMYWFASRHQRLAVLQGLMDTDGSISSGKQGVKGTRCTFTNTNRRLVDAVLYLCRSLGIKAKIRQTNDSRPGSSVCWQVTFITVQPVFRLKRKLAKIPGKTKPSTHRRYVVSVEPVPSRPVRCIAVNSTSRLYLCGEALIPTHNSAHSPAQNVTREDLISGAVLGMSGPGRTMSAVMPCTVIAQGDMISNILDRKKHPMWRGERTPMLSAMPKNMKAWEPYFEIFRRCAQQEPPDYSEANSYYVAHRAELDEGAEATWPERKVESRGEVSGIQGAMNIYCLVGPAKFAAEDQGDPLPEVADVPGLEPDSIAAKVNRLPRGIVPVGATHLVAMIDVHKALLYYVVFGCADDFRHAGVVDYGTYPDQGRPYFALADANPTLESKAPHAGMEGAVTAGLTALEAKLLDEPWKREGGGTASIELCLVDSGWRSDIIRQFCRRSKHPTILLPSMGRSIRSTQAPMSMWKKKEGDRVPANGLPWRIIPVDQGTVRTALFDANWYKSFLRDRLAQQTGDRGSISLFGDDHGLHRMLAEHLTGERPKLATSDGRTVEEWIAIPGRDLHLGDCLVGCMVAASIQGAGMLDQVKPTASKRTAADYARAVAEHKRRRA